MLKGLILRIKKRKVEKIISHIKSVKIQGARNIAKAALKAYCLLPTKEVKERLINARPTEPMLINTLNYFGKFGKEKTLSHFDRAQNAINQFVFKLIKNNSIVFTHCHSTNVINALIYAKNNGKKFKVYNTETRPLMQGRKTSQDLKSAGIDVTEFIDSAARVALVKENRGDKLHADIVFLGADAILKAGVINKIGSGMFSEIAFDNHIPVYIVADSWKFSKKKVPIEQRALNEVWNKASEEIRIENPAFEFIPKKYIKGIVSELGVLPLHKFLDSAEKSIKQPL